MSLTSIVFSKDRPAQLDLLLRSLKANGDELADRVIVICRLQPEYRDGYATCELEHPDVDLWIEGDFQRDVLDALSIDGDHVCFFTDDSILYRPLDGLPWPEVVLDDEDVLFFSLRLGLNTGQCYPLRRLQGLPSFVDHDAVLQWPWRTGDGDFGYPGSVDGHVFRTDDVRDWLDGETFTGPNELEETLMRNVVLSQRDMGACYRKSHLVGVPINRVQDLRPNRHSELYGYEPADLAETFSCGGRLSLDSMDFGNVTAAHAELRLTFA